MDDAALIDAYWDIVEECLIRLLGRSPDEARQLAERGRTQFDDAGHGSGVSLAYHEEPFYAAFALAHPELDRRSRSKRADGCLDDRQAEYNAILDAHYGRA